MRTIRDEAIPASLASNDPAWLLDQLVHETIGVDLAEEGWEAIGEGGVEDDPSPGIAAIATSPVWIIRRT